MPQIEDPEQLTEVVDIETDAIECSVRTRGAWNTTVSVPIDPDPTNNSRAEGFFGYDPRKIQNSITVVDDVFVGGHAVVFGDKFPMPMGRNYIVDYRFSDNYKKKRNAQRKARAITRKHLK